MDQNQNNGIQQRQQAQQGQNSNLTALQNRQKLQLRTSQLPPEQLEQLYQRAMLQQQRQQQHDHEQQQEHERELQMQRHQLQSPYSIDFSNVLFPPGLMNSIANNLALINSFNNDLTVDVANNVMNGQNFITSPTFYPSLHGQASRGSGSPHGASDPTENVSSISPSQSPLNGSRSTVKRSSSSSNAKEALAASSPVTQANPGERMSPVPSKSHSTTQSDFQTQTAHKRSNSAINQQNFGKHRESFSYPFSLDMDTQMESGPGVAPTTSGGGVNSGTSSTLTEFTKRRNWSQRIIEELQDLLCILTPSGKLRYCSPNTKVITGYSTEEILGRMVTDFVHPDDSHIFIREFNEAIAASQALRIFFRFKRKDNSFAIFEANGHPHFSDQRQVVTNTTTPVCSGFFMMARLYPTKNTALLDSFLEHKIENERLKRRIAELRQEEQEEQQAQARARAESISKGNETNNRTGIDGIFKVPSLPRSLSVPSSLTGSVESAAEARPAPTSKTMPPPPAVQGQLTRQNLDSLNSTASTRDSLREKMARYEGVTHADTIEMLTGLRYTEGERSRGISTGDTSPSLIRGDAGVPMSADRESRGSGERKKKIKVSNEYVCTDCGTLDSPEWRKGPTGPKTLCNACGLRWAKKEKKRNSVSGPTHPPPLGGPVPPVPSMPHSTSI